MITINPATQLGIDDRVGTLEKGKDGDVVVFKNHPLSIYAIPQYTIVDGVVKFNIEEDPEDMRVDIDPEESIPTFYEAVKHTHDGQSTDGCLQDVFLHDHKH